VTEVGNLGMMNADERADGDDCSYTVETEARNSVKYDDARN